MNTTNHTSPIGEDAANGAIGERARLDDVAPLVDEWIRNRGTSMDGSAYVAALQLAEHVKARAALTAEKVAVGERETSAHETLLQALGYPWLPCPICKGTEGCDHSAPERARAALTAEKVAAEPVAEVTCIHPSVCPHAFIDDDGSWNCAQCMTAAQPANGGTS